LFYPFRQFVKCFCFIIWPFVDNFKKHRINC
jgi:hypothetical protein